MYTHKTLRLFLTGFLLVTTSFSSLVISPAQADTGSAVTLSPTVIAKLDAFLVKVQAKRSSSSSDENWWLFIDNLSKKVIALKPRYADNLLILAVLDRLNSGVVGLKNTIASASLVDNEDLCAKEGLTNNIDELNWESKRDAHVYRRGQFSDWDMRGYAYKMNAGESYSFPIRMDVPLHDLSDYYIGGSFPHIYNVSEKKCDFTNIKQEYGCAGIGTQDNAVQISVNAKFADPSWKPLVRDAFSQPPADTSEYGYGCRLVPGKKYYLNVRWIRKSDFVDASGNIRNDGTSILSIERNNLRSKSGIDLKKYLDETFNGYGDNCIPTVEANGMGARSCFIDYSFGTSAPGMDKWSPQKRTEMKAKQEAVAAEEQRQYQIDLNTRAATETTANPYGLVCPAGQRAIGASCH